MIENITPLIIAYNEEPNIARTLDRLVWASRIVVIDSGSTDKTVEIVRSYRQAEVFHRDFDDFASQWNFGNEQVNSDWVLSLDADYELSGDLIVELRGLNSNAAADGYRAQVCLSDFRSAPSRIALSAACGTLSESQGSLSKRGPHPTSGNCGQDFASLRRDLS